MNVCCSDMGMASHCQELMLQPYRNGKAFPDEMRDGKVFLGSTANVASVGGKYPLHISLPDGYGLKTAPIQRLLCQD